MNKSLAALFLSLASLTTLSAAGCASATGEGDVASESEGLSGCTGLNCTTPKPPPATCPPPPTQCTNNGDYGLLTGATECGRELMAAHCIGNGDLWAYLPVIQEIVPKTGEAHYWHL